MKSKYVIGVDFGTDSVRAIVMDAVRGEEMVSSVSPYLRWSRGAYCDPAKNQFRQHPLDYIESFEAVIKDCLSGMGAHLRDKVCGISFATTGSSPVAVNRQGVPLALLEDFKENPNAMFILWKDHTAIKEAEEINNAAKNNQWDYLKYVGGVYSSEWYWAKLLHVLRADKEVGKACYTWVEHSDWMPFLLIGGTDAAELKRNVCAAGHKALWAKEFNGFPSPVFFEAIDPVLLPFLKRFGQKVYTAEQAAGTISWEWAARLGLPADVVVGIGAIDAHMGAVGGRIKPYYLSKVIGTSTCDMMVVPKSAMKGVFVKGISGQVDDSIIPGMIGLEAGQSAFGDMYTWFKNLLLWPLKGTSGAHAEMKAIFKGLEVDLLKKLDQQAAQLSFDIRSEFALDWFNGRRTPNANPSLKGLIGNLTLGSSAPEIYRALVEATCFGSRAIVESMEEQKIEIRGVDAIGGIAVKSEFVMQTMADVLDRPVHVSRIEQTVALGAAIFASVVGGVYEGVMQAGEIMGAGENRIVNPRKRYVALYNERYEEYQRYGEMQA